MVDDEWIGVDFDGTLVEYHGWASWNSFGRPIPAMVERVRRWLAEGKNVRIFTARVGIDRNEINTCRHTGARFTNMDMRLAIGAWCQEHVGESLRVQCYKDLHCIEIWDDRAVQVVANTGRTLAEEHEAEMTALRGKAFGS